MVREPFRYPGNRFVIPAIRLYVERLADVQGGHQQAPWQPRDDTSDEDDNADGRLFPIFNPGGREVSIPPIEVQLPGFPWQAIFGLLLTGAWPLALVLLGIWGVKAWRSWRKGRGENLVFEGDVATGDTWPLSAVEPNLAKRRDNESCSSISFMAAHLTKCTSDTEPPIRFRVLSQGQESRIEHHVRSLA